MARGQVARRGGAPWLLGLPVAFLAACLLAPLVSVVTTAFGDGGAGTFATLLRDHVFTDAAVRTVVLASVVTACCWVLGLAYGLGLAVTTGAARAALLGALLAVFWTSLVVRSYGWLLVFKPLDLLQTTIAMYPAMVHVMLPLMVLPVYGAVRRLDQRRIWAARSLGAGPAMLLRRVVLPELRLAGAAGAVLVFISSLGFYVTPALLGGPSNLTTGTLIAQEFNDVLDFGTASAMGVLLLAAVVVLYVLSDRLLGVSRQWGQR